MTASARELAVLEVLQDLLVKAGERVALAGVKVGRISTAPLPMPSVLIAGVQVLVDDVAVYAATVELDADGIPKPLSRAGAWLTSGLRERGLDRLADQVETVRPRAAS